MAKNKEVDTQTRMNALQLLEHVNKMYRDHQCYYMEIT
jgi:hypothetical protein